MNFGEAIEALKRGDWVQRAGWNGKNMHIYLEDSPSFMFKDGVYKGQERKYDPVIVMYHRAGYASAWVAWRAKPICWLMIGSGVTA